MKSQTTRLSASVRQTILASLMVATVGCGNSFGNEDSQPTVIKDSGAATSKPAAVPQQDQSSNDLQDTIDSLKSNYPAVRFDSIKRLGDWKIEPGSEQAAQVINKLFELRLDEYNDFEDTFINKSLQTLSESTLAEIDKLLKLGNDKAIYQAVELMRALGPTYFEQLSPKIQSLLDSDDKINRWQAFYALEGLGPSGAKFLDDIVKQMNSKDFQDQQIALRVLSVIGPDAMKVLPEVRELANTGQNISVKSHSMIAMGNIAAGSNDSEAVAKQLLGYLDEFSFVSKERALTGLIAMKKDAAVATEAAKKLMENDKSGLAAKATYLYGLTTGDWETASKKLADLCNDLSVGFEAVTFLKDIGPDAKAATEALLFLTRSEDESLAAPAIEALAKIYANPTKDDPEFKKVADRFQEISGDVTEAGYIALKQMEAWQKAGKVDIKAAETDK